MAVRWHDGTFFGNLIAAHEATMQVISCQHSRTREDTLLNTHFLSALHAHSDSGPAWADLTPKAISDHNRSQLCSATTRTVVGDVCHSKMERARESGWSPAG